MKSRARERDEGRGRVHLPQAPKGYVIQCGEPRTGAYVERSPTRQQCSVKCGPASTATTTQTIPFLVLLRFLHRLYLLWTARYGPLRRPRRPPRLGTSHRSVRAGRPEPRRCRQPTCPCRRDKGPLAMRGGGCVSRLSHPLDASHTLTNRLCPTPVCLHASVLLSPPPPSARAYLQDADRIQVSI